MSLLRTNDVIASQNENFCYVKVRFNLNDGGKSQKLYTYKTLDNSIEPGDELVVISPHNGTVIVTVTEVLEHFEVEDATYNYKWVVQKVDLAAYDELKQKERTIQKELARINTKVRLENTLAKAIEKLGEANVMALKAIARL